MFMIFGYANGTDSIIDINELLSMQSNELNFNFFNYLYKNYTIENNIFGYLPVKAIKFISIPNEINIFISHETQSKIPLESD